MNYKFSIRTVLLVSFLFVALLTPIFAYVSYDMVQDTGKQSEEVIENTKEITNLSQESVFYSQQIINNLENIREYQQQSNQSGAEVEADELTDNFQEFVDANNEIIEYMEESEEEFTEERDAIRETQDEMETLIQYTLSTVDQGVVLGSFAIEDSRDQLDRASRASVEISNEVVSSETSELLTLNEKLRSLSVTILIAGSMTIIVGIVFALAISMLVSRPIEKLESEADKIKKEEFGEVNLERVDTNIKEFDSLKEMIENVVLALKSEFEREREGMNDLALDLVSILSKEIPRGVAESSLSSAAEKAGVSPVDMKKEDAKEIIKNLEVSTRGLGVDNKTFEEMRERIS